MFKDSLACIQNFVESDDKIQFIWNVGDVGNMECCVMLGCWMLVMWDVGDVGYPGCEMLAMWDVEDLGCCECGMLEMLDVGNVGCWRCGMFGMWHVYRDVGC